VWKHPDCAPAIYSALAPRLRPTPPGKPHARFDEGRLARHLAGPAAYSTRLPVDLITKGTLADSWTARFEGDATYCSSQAIAGYHVVRTGPLLTY
jgi:hypothetical protein